MEDFWVTLDQLGEGPIHPVLHGPKDPVLVGNLAGEYDLNSRSWAPLEEAWQDLNYHGET